MAYPYSNNSNYYTPYSYNSNGNYGYNQQPNFQQANNYQQNSYGNYQQNQMQVQQQAPQTIYYPLTYVNGIEGAKAFIVQPNQIFYLVDSDNDVLYRKSLNEKNMPVLEAYQLTRIDLNSNKPTIQNENKNYITNDILTSQIMNLENNFNIKINELNNKINSLSKQHTNINSKAKSGEKNE